MEDNSRPLETQDNNRIVPVNIEEQMKTAYIDYSMSVIVGRALPDVRDGLKPVHRRILFGMKELGNNSNKPYKKAARIVGEVMGKFHPHGDASIFDAMVRMAQEWSMRYLLVDGQGNFGNQDGDGPAAMRYIEARLHRQAEYMLEDIDKETVDFQPNFDDSLEEPTVLPTRIPQLLMNGSSGIAVGMATNMMPHNLSEVIDGCMAYIDKRDISVEGLMQHIKAPDFPTGGIIYGMEGVKAAMHFGRGRGVLRGKLHVDTKASGREQVIVTEVPYQVNRDALCDRIGQLVNEKILPYTDFRRTTQLAMGRNWRAATPDQQNAVVEQFKMLLIRTYAGALAQVKNQEIQYKPFRMNPDDTDTVVRSVVMNNGSPVELDYRLYKTPQGWRVYDINVLGAWLIQAYQQQFNEQIQQHGVDGLIQFLTQRNQQLAAGKQS